MTREQLIARLREHASSQGKIVTDDMLKTANLVYDAVEQWKAAAFAEEEAFRNFVWLNERIDSGDAGISLATANGAAELLESLEGLDQEEAAVAREELRRLIDEFISNAHEIARICLTRK